MSTYLSTINFNVNNYILQLKDTDLLDVLKNKNK